MPPKKPVAFIHSYKGFIAGSGMVLIIAGFGLNYILPKEGTRVSTEWFKGEIPTMAFVGLALILVPYLALYLIQTVASKFGKKSDPPTP